MSIDESVDELTSLIGREVYTTNGMFVGDVADVKLNLDEEVAKGLAVRNANVEFFGTLPDAEGVMIPYRWIRSIGDVVLINTTVERLLDGDAE